MGRTGLITGALCMALCACSATVDPDAFVATCVAGETAPCTCEDGVEGAKTCRADGSGYGDCDCRVIEGPGGDEAAGDGCGGRGGEECTVPALGPCARGVLRCSDGVLNCESLHTPEPEKCNGIDDNCDGAIDEGEPEAGVDCETAALGVCKAGLTVCAAGQLSCIQKNGAGTEACDGLDNDCDGDTDEEVPGQCAICQADRDVDASAEGLCATGVTVCADQAMRCVPLLPQEWAPAVGCDGLDSDCDGTVDETAEALPPGPERMALARELCGSPLAGPEGRAPCPEDPNVLTWSCEPGEAGAVCSPVGCGEGFRIEDRGCVPDVERCNDGIDDDGDGLIDGTTDGADPCAVEFDQGDEALRFGRCPSDRHRQGCEGSDVQRRLGQTHSHCSGNECPHDVTLTYRYALDVEEVSVRAYQQCVDAGCCAAPSGHVWKLAQTRREEAGLGRRPDDHERCQRPPPLALDRPETDELIFDLPVVGVSWCQARDYCNWAGKRLPTEYEWERAAVGMDPTEPRVWSWGNDPASRCVAEECCRAEDFEWDPAEPGECDPTRVELRICEEAPPETVRRACLATQADPPGTCQRHDRRRDCPGCVFGPAPVWANEDGATPEGLLNMTGNVYEWVFDWWSRTFDGHSHTDPVGPGCDLTVAGGQRSVRGGGLLTDAKTGNLLRHQQGLLSARLGYVGFRCARTLPDEGGACDPQMPEAPNRCRAPRARQPCSAPDFDNDHAGDLRACPDGRVQSANCSLGLDRYCAMDTGPGCSGLIVRTMRFDANVLTDFIPEALLVAAGIDLERLYRLDTAAIMNGFIEGLLATNGGETLFMMDLPDGFGGPLTYRGDFANVIADGDGQLKWLGLLDGGRCVPTDRFELAVPTSELELDFEALCMTGLGSLWMIEAPISFAFSGLAMRGERTEEGVAGGFLAFVTLEDGALATMGDPDVQDDTLLRARLPPLDLCPVRGLLGCEESLPGCQGEGAEAACPQDDERCRGWLLPLSVEAVRRDLVNLPGLAACEDPEPD